MPRRPRPFVIALVLAFVGAWTHARAEPDGSGSETFAYAQPDAVVNAGLDPLDPNAAAIRSSTPRDTLESLLLLDAQGRHAESAHLLDLRDIPAAERSTLGPELARKLAYVVRRKVWVDWHDVPTTPDALGIPANSTARTPIARRQFALGTIDFRDRPVPVELWRVVPRDSTETTDARWLFAPYVVSRTDALFDEFGPTRFERAMPDVLRTQTLGQVMLWEWISFLLIGLVAAGATWGGMRILRAWLDRISSPLVKRVRGQIRWPAVALIASSITYAGSSAVLSLMGPAEFVFHAAMTVLVIGTLTWLCMRAVGALTEIARDRLIEDLDDEDNGASRSLATNLTVARQLVIFVIFILGCGLVLSHFDVSRTLGVSVLASAGVASVVLGVAARDTLGNVIAGLQIAISKPVRIGDNVFFEDDWGWIEEITYTYLTIRTWDLRRIVVPLQYFIAHPIENWSKSDAAMFKPIHLYVDFRTDVEALRQHFVERVKAAEQWDGEREPHVEVTGWKDDVLEVRCVCSANTPSDAWQLHCNLREEMQRYMVHTADGACLPRRRFELDDRRERDPDSAGTPPSRRTSSDHRTNSSPVADA